MDDKFQNKYRISSTRLQNWDYGWNAPYFVTICTQKREHYFGEIVDGKMQFSEIGKIAQQFWHEIPDHFPFVILDAFVVMPNHVHGIIIINKTGDGCDGGGDGGVATQNFASLRQNRQQSHPKNKFGPQSQNLASIVRGYKTGVKKHATMNIIDFAWQPRFNDHIIRNNHSFDRIRNYINTNIKNWKTDEFYE
jgi:REP element-mobilizing transposase RayT